MIEQVSALEQWPRETFMSVTFSQSKNGIFLGVCISIKFISRLQGYSVGGVTQQVNNNLKIQSLKKLAPLNPNQTTSLANRSATGPAPQEGNPFASKLIKPKTVGNNGEGANVTKPSAGGRRQRKPKTQFGINKNKKAVREEISDLLVGYINKQKFFMNNSVQPMINLPKNSLPLDALKFVDELLVKK